MPAGYALYEDFLGETSPEDEARMAAERKAATTSPEAKLAQQLAERRQNAFTEEDASSNPLGAVSRTGQQRSQLIGSGQKVSTVSPGQYGQFSYKRQGKPIDAYTANAPNDFFGDLARLGTYFGTAAANPIGTLLDGYLPEGAQAAINPVGYATQAGADELLDRTLTNGSGAYGNNLIPGRAGTGGDVMTPSEMAGMPKVPMPGGGAGSSGSGGAATPGASARPDQYRTDALDPQIQAMLDAERRGGPSEAEALLKKATDRVAARSLGIAAGARGGAGARERARNQAVAANTSLGSQAAADTAALRAREANESKVRQQAIMQLLQNNAAAGDVRDLGYQQTESGERQARYNVDATNARFNAQQPVGLTEDPLSWLFEGLTGRPLRSKTV